MKWVLSPDGTYREKVSDKEFSRLQAKGWRKLFNIQRSS